MNDVVLNLRKAGAVEVVTSLPARRVVMVVAFAVLTALSAYVIVPVPGTPVPVTLQTMVVLLAGALLGPRLGAASQVSYLTAGALGAPVFSAGIGGLPHLFGPTGGFLLAFPATAALVGLVAGGAKTGAARLLVALALGAATILVGGAAQLAALTGDAVGAVQLGVMPFLFGDALKIAVALAIASRLRARTLERV